MEGGGDDVLFINFKNFFILEDVDVVVYKGDMEREKEEEASGPDSGGRGEAQEQALKEPSEQALKEQLIEHYTTGPDWVDKKVEEYTGEALEAGPPAPLPEKLPKLSVEEAFEVAQEVALRNHTRRARGMVDKAMREVVKILELSGDDNCRLKAAEMVFTQAFGKPKSRDMGEDGVNIRQIMPSIEIKVLNTGGQGISPNLPGVFIGQAKDKE